MIKKIQAFVKERGIGGLLQEAYRRTFPVRLAAFPECRPFFESRIGLEIGGPSSVFGRSGYVPVYPVAARIDNCNFGGHTVWEGDISEGETFTFDKDKGPGRQFVMEASSLQSIDDATYDFLLSSHCIEHLANPLQGLAAWVRVLKEDAVMALIVPHKDGTFDHRRPVTSMQHLIQDLNDQTTEHDLTHLEEILQLHDLKKDPGGGTPEAFEKRSRRNFENRCMHQHVFDTRLVVEVIDYAGLQILALEVFRPFHIVAIAKKPRRGQPPDNGRLMAAGEVPPWISPFPSDRRSRQE
jgi:SAM-dependent methyltransferase